MFETINIKGAFIPDVVDKVDVVKDMSGADVDRLSACCIAAYGYWYR